MIKILNNMKTWLAVSLILVAVLSRLAELPVNFAAIGGVALFSGAYLKNRNLAFLVPLSALFITDLIIGLHADLFAVYFSFVLIVALGMLVSRKPGIMTTAAASVTGSVLFFIITNFSVWVTGTMYPKTLEGLGTCYVMAVPFFGNTLAGDLLFTAVLFGSYELVTRTVLKAVPQQA
ncbi:MAG: hypothetical protein HRU80_05560 [Ignavibacteriales bacterium]|nr:MAG: hypothetical protein HRU80_05560 [Ignavibacteriales bacterium]